MCYYVLNSYEVLSLVQFIKIRSIHWIDYDPLKVKEIGRCRIKQSDWSIYVTILKNATHYPTLLLNNHAKESP